MVSLDDNIGRGRGPLFCNEIMFHGNSTCFDLLCILLKLTFACNNWDFWSLSMEMPTVVLRDFIISGLVGALLVDRHYTWIYFYLAIYRDYTAMGIFQVYIYQLIFH